MIPGSAMAGIGAAVPLSVVASNPKSLYALMLTVTVGLAGCSEKLDCSAGGVSLKPGEYTTIMGRKYTAGPKGCCLKLTGGGVATDCDVGAP